MRGLLGKSYGISNLYCALPVECSAFVLRTVWAWSETRLAIDLLEFPCLKFHNSHTKTGFITYTLHHSNFSLIRKLFCTWQRRNHRSTLNKALQLNKHFTGSFRRNSWMFWSEIPCIKEHTQKNLICSCQ